MKTKLLLLLLMAFCPFLHAQTTPDCKASEINDSFLRNNPDAKRAHDEFNEYTRQFVEDLNAGRIERRATYTIPVVVHVYGTVHSGQTVTEQKVITALEKLNEDFNGLNDDWNTIDANFDPIKATLDIEFKLAKIDPNGASTSGVVFYPAESGMGNYGSPAVARDGWDNYKYMNVYITNDLYGDGVLTNSGVAWYPNTTMSDLDIARVVYNGAYLHDNTNKEFASVFTHEFGHYLNLIHTHEGGCSGTDQVADTPQDTRDNGGGCSETSDCGALINYENYMGYNGAAGCYKMYTQGQVARMLAALNHPTRQPLWQTQNLIDTGVDDSVTSFLSNDTPNLLEAIANDGSFDQTPVITITGTTFTQSSGALVENTHYTTNLPAGLDVTIAVNSNQQLTVTVTGNAAAHANANDANGSITLLDAAITGGASSLATANIGLSFNFLDPYEIIYVDIEDQTVNSTTTWDPFAVQEGSDPAYGAFYENGNLRFETYQKPIVCETGTRNISLLPANTSITSSSNWVDGGAYPDLHDLRTSTYTTWDGQQGYFGFQVQINGRPCYGWFRAEVNATGDSYTIFDYAYNTEPFGTIVTGATNGGVDMSISPTGLGEDAANDGSIPGQATLSLVTNGGTFTQSSGNFVENTHYTITGVPAGLSANLTVSNNTTLTVGFSGNANDHADANDANVTVTFLDAAITGGASVLTSTSFSIDLDFLDPYGIFYVDIADLTVDASNTWEFFRIEQGDNTDYGVFVDGGDLRLETYTKPLVCEGTTRNVTPIGFDSVIDDSSNFVDGGAYPDLHNIRDASYTAWDGVTGFIGFRFTINGNPCYGWFRITVSGDGTSYTLTDYAYNTQPNGAIPTPSAGGNPPTAPSALGATVDGSAQITLNWTDNANDESGFHVFRDGSQIASLGADVTTYVDTGLTPETSYSYQVRAFNASGNSTFSNTVNATTDAEGNTDYCTPAANSPSTRHITNVDFGSISNGTADSATGYAYYDALSTNVEVGQGYPITVTVSHGFEFTTAGNRLAIWADWNQDLDFNDQDELIATLNNDGTTSYATTINIPNHALAGSTRLRIRHFYAFGAGDVGDACSATEPEGEVEDYILNISAGSVQLATKVYLQGAFLGVAQGVNLMRDDLRANNHLPTDSPYENGVSVNASVFGDTGTASDNIVDWVLVELRDATTNTNILASTSALLQRDGDVVSLDGNTPLAFTVAPGNYYIAIKHRNHLGIMTANTVALSSTVSSIDFTDASNSITFGSNAQTSFGMPSNTFGMWAGDANNDGQVVFLNTGAESVTIKQLVLDVSTSESPFGASVFYKPTGYYATDLYLDGETIFLNAGNELLTIKDNILAHPSNQLFNSVFYVIESQLPENNMRTPTDRTP